MCRDIRVEVVVYLHQRCGMEQEVVQRTIPTNERSPDITAHNTGKLIFATAAQEVAGL